MSNVNVIIPGYRKTEEDTPPCPNCGSKDISCYTNLLSLCPSSGKTIVLYHFECSFCKCEWEKLVESKVQNIEE